MFILGYILGGMSAIIVQQFLKQYSIVKKNSETENNGDSK